MSSEKENKCEDCGMPMSSREGGNTFTCCDACWEKHYENKERTPMTAQHKQDEITRSDIAFMVQEIISEAHSRPQGAEMIDLIDKYADKFCRPQALLPLEHIPFHDHEIMTLNGVDYVMKSKVECYINSFGRPAQEPSLEEIVKVIREFVTKELINNSYVPLGSAMEYGDYELALAIQKLIKEKR